jgi:tetratricopeptide (TPR) repeat protein
MAAILNPSSLEAHEELARIAERRGDISLLAIMAEKVVTSSPNSPEGYVWRAIAEMNRNSASKAEADLKTALQIDPADPRANFQLGKLRFEQKRFAEGVPFLEKALRRNPDSVGTTRLLVGYDLSLKQPQRALARVNAQISKSPKNGGLYDLLAQVQIERKNLDQAAISAGKAFQLNSSDGEAGLLVAQIAILRDQTTKAIATWERRSNDHPNDAGALAILGTLEESRGDLKKAKTYYQKSLQIQAHEPVAANNLAYLMLQVGENPAQALALAKTARQGMPDSPNTADTLAWAYYCNGDYEPARNLLIEAMTADQDNAPMHYHLGMVYSKLKDKQSAQIQLKKALSLAPDTQTAKEARDALHGLG